MSSDRTSVNVPCPGTTSNGVVLIGSDWQCAYGIANLANTGDCRLYMIALDANGAYNRNLPDVYLEPGDTMSHYTPPANAAQVLVVCSKDCSGQGVLEYDTPNS